MREILEEDECNDTYGRVRMYQALTWRHPEHVDIPSKRTVYRIMEEIRPAASIPDTGQTGSQERTGTPKNQTIS